MWLMYAHHMPLDQRALFVYYHVNQTRSADAFVHVSRLQQQLRERVPGLQARLMRRSDEDPTSTEQTWMEVYEHADGIDVLSEQMLHELVSALPAGLIGPRHQESFSLMPACRTDLLG
jgi:hypothetical protein